MEEPAFDFDQVFDTDYLYFYEPILTDERNDREAELIVRLLDLPRGARVLDLPCGHGRIANRLAGRGYLVTGLDRSEMFLAHAVRDAADGRVKVEYVRGDMRSLLWEPGFDAVVNWFTAFGYFSDDDNRRVLREIRRVLRPGGSLVLELNNRDRILKEFLPWVVLERDGAFMIDRHRFDAERSAMENERIVIRDGRVRRFVYTIRMFTYAELRDWLLDAGFSVVRGFDETGAPYGLSSQRMVMLATA